MAQVRRPCGGVWLTPVCDVHARLPVVWPTDDPRAGLAVAVVVPNFLDKHKRELPENPPSLKEVRGGGRTQSPESGDSSA
jgi:hypothetical protein